MAFLESPRFPDCIAYGSQGGPAYNTSVIVLNSGKEQRNQNWELPRHEFDVAFGVKSQSDLEDLIDMFHQVHGSLDGFRFKNFLDMNSGHTNETPNFLDQNIGTANGVTTQFQLKKTYASGAFNNITKPVSATTVVGVNGIQVMSGFTVDTTTGIITFSVAPAAGAVTAGFEYDLPVRFESDRLAVSIDSFLLGTTSVRLVEIK